MKVKIIYYPLREDWYETSKDILNVESLSTVKDTLIVTYKGEDGLLTVENIDLKNLPNGAIIDVSDFKEGDSIWRNEV